MTSKPGFQARKRETYSMVDPAPAKKSLSHTGRGGGLIDSDKAAVPPTMAAGLRQVLLHDGEALSQLLAHHLVAPWDCVLGFWWPTVKARRFGLWSRKASDPCKERRRREFLSRPLRNQATCPKYRQAKAHRFSLTDLKHWKAEVGRTWGNCSFHVDD